MPRHRLPKTTQRLDVVCQILREDNGLTAAAIASRMSPDLLGLASDPALGAWTPERLANLGHVLYPLLTMLEKDGTIFCLREVTRANVWFLAESNKVLVDPAIVEVIESLVLR